MKITVFNPKIGFCQEKIFVTSPDKLSNFLIGRHPKCDLVLNTPEISRVHGLITYNQQNFYFTELASTGGSLLNNKEVSINQNCLLATGDILYIGDFYLILLFESQTNVNVNANPYWFLKSQTNNNSAQLTSVQQDELIIKCSQIIEETQNVKTFRFTTSARKFDYKPGQFITLDLVIDDKPVKRSYSISSTPSRPHNLEITVKRVPAPSDVPDAPPGLISNWLHDNLTAGSQIKISPPMGKFTCFDNPNRKFMFISAGSGITPMMSMSRWLSDITTNADITFVHSAKTVRDIIFRQELELIASQNPNFKLAINLTGTEYNPTWLGYSGRLNEGMIKEMSPDFRERTVYVCGPDGFRESVKAMLREFELPMDYYHEESFGSSKKTKKSQSTVSDNSVKYSHPASSETVATTENNNAVVFTKSGKEVVCDDNDTILEAAQREGVTLPYGCQMGACGQCKLRKISGQVDYEQDPDCEDEYVLSCVAKAMGSVVIEA